MSSETQTKIGKVIGENIIMFTLSIILIVFTFKINAAMDKMENLITKEEVIEIVDNKLSTTTVIVDSHSESIGDIKHSLDIMDEKIENLQIDMNYAKGVLETLMNNQVNMK